MGGNCIIYEEFWRQPKEVAFEQVSLYRVCDKYLATPFNFYSTIVTNATSMTICDTDLCNQKGSSTVATLSLMLFIVIYSCLWFIILKMNKLYLKSYYWLNNLVSVYDTCLFFCVRKISEHMIWFRSYIEHVFSEFNSI